MRIGDGSSAVCSSDLAGQAVESPSLGAMIARCLRSSQSRLAFATVEFAQVAAAERHPHDTVAINVCAAYAVPRCRYVVELAQRRVRIESQERDERKSVGRGKVV